MSWLFTLRSGFDQVVTTMGLGIPFWAWAIGGVLVVVAFAVLDRRYVLRQELRTVSQYWRD